MKKIGLVAAREFVATVFTRGFIIGLLIMPAIIGLAFVLGPRILNARSPQVSGDVAVIDPTGRVAGRLRETIAAEAIRARQQENVRRAMAQAAPGLGESTANQAAEASGSQVPLLRLVDRPADADVEQEKRWLLAGTEADRHLALVVVHPDAAERRDGRAEFGTYDLYLARGVDDATNDAIYDSLREALVDARLEAASLDQATIEATMRVPRSTSVIVAEGGEQRARPGLTRMLPFILGILLFIGVMIGGQTLMTSTIEEKSSRVVEVLLAAVSPFELMAGKLLGQMGVGLLVMSLYIGLGVMALMSFAMFGLIDPMLIVYLLVFFVITYLVFGALMMAIGAAVNEMAEAQSLVGPVMMLLVLPYILTPMIGRAPNSTFSVAVSFIPPVNSFAMLARLASETPPPAWQVWLTALVGLAAAVGAIWFAAKVFKIGLLMHGKPPNLATLIRWARAA
jgi:ABC-2 type transport system permease protein